VVFKTTDGGEIWVKQDSVTAEFLNAIQFPADAQTGYAVGRSGTIIKTTDGGAAVAETPSAELRTAKAATIVRGSLFLANSARSGPSRLLDAAGRRMVMLRPGANDVRALAPGVYFVREEPQASSSKPQAVRKVVIQR
jgi:photosystem II stability/assembly factor-like uncharacterized protein